MNTKKLTGCLILFFSFIGQTEAAKRYWVSLITSNWNQTLNWSTSSGGVGGSSVPGSNDTVYFDGGGIGKCTLDVAINIKRLEINSGYTDTLKQNGQTITIGTSGYTQAAGVFYGNTGSITNSGIFTLSAGVFYSTGSTMTTTGNFTFSGGTFHHNNGLIKFTATNTITGTITLYDLEFSASSSDRTFTIASGTTITVNHNYTLSGTNGITLNTGNIDLLGNVYMNNTSTVTGGNAIVSIKGTVKQTINGATPSFTSRFPHLVINKTDTLVLTNLIGILGDFTYTAGVISYGTSTVNFSGGKTITGSCTLYHVTVSGGGTFTVASGTTITSVGTLTIQGTINTIINTGTFEAKGDITMTNTATAGGGSGLIYITGTGSQTFTGEGTIGNGRFPKVRINKASGTLSLASIISVANDWTYTAGTVSAGSSTVAFLGNLTIDGTHSLNNAEFGSGATYTISSGTVLTLNGYMKLRGTVAISINTGTIYAKGNVISENTATTGGGTALIEINGTGTQTLTGSGVAGQGKFCNVTINKSSGTLTLADIITFDKNFIYTAGTVSGGTSTCAFYGSGTLDPENSSYSVPFYDVIIAASRTLSGKLTVLHDLTVNTSQTLTNGGFDIDLGRNWVDNGTFSTSGGYVKLNGTGSQSVSKGSGSETLKKLWVNNSATGTITFSSPVIVTDTFKLTEGKVVTTSTNLLTLNDNAGVLGGSDTGYVSGPMKKIGNEAITFPLGNTSLSSGAYHPLGITAPSSATDAFTAEYKVANPTTVYGTTLSDSIESVSTCEYWVLDRNVGSSNVKPTLGWNSNFCLGNTVSEMEVAIWNGSKWNNLGASSRTVIANSQRGTVTANLNATYTSSPLTFSKSKLADYALLKRKLDGGLFTATNSILRIKYDEEYMDGDGIVSFRIISTASNTVVLTDANIQTAFKTVAFGDNRYGYDLSQYSLSSGYYILEVTNEKSEKMYLRFKI